MTPLIAFFTLMTPPAPAPVASPFPLSDVHVLGGPFETEHEATAKYLLELEPARLLAGFRVNSGLKAGAEIYGGWETGGLSGHSLGHYLSACAQEFARTGDARFKQKVDALVDGLAECQAARPDGFLMAFRFQEGFDKARLDKIWADVAAGKIRSSAFDLNGMWSPWYVHHKVLAGLLDADELCDNHKALQVAAKFADWAIEETKNLTPEQWQHMLGTEYGGVNESFAELYTRTHEAKYLELAQKFYDKRVLDPLGNGQDDLNGKHSNTQIPKIIGLARLYEITGDDKDRKTAEFFWDCVVDHRTYAIGGNSNGEYLGPRDQLAERISSNTCETCNTYNMLKLTRHLFEWAPDAAKMDFYERAYLNHILGSQDPSTGMVTYFMNLQTGAARNFSNPYDDFTCCHGTGMENHTKHGDTAYFHDGASRLWVNLFMPTELDWKDAGVKVRQDTAFPLGNSVKLTVQGSARFAMLIRHPGWATGEIVYKVNGKVAARSSKPSSYVSIDRAWKSGDRVEFVLPMALHTEATPDNANKIALLYGPIVLAADMGPAPSSRRAPNDSDLARLENRAPVLVTNGRPISDWLKPVGQPLTFKSENVAEPADLTFRAFYTFNKDRYGVYFNSVTPSEWEAAEAEFKVEEARLKDLEARTVDRVIVGRQRSERDHAMTQEHTDMRDANGRSFRTPLNGGYFECSLKADASKPQEIVVTYWGNDRIRPDFTISAEGQEIGGGDLADKPHNKFFDVVYPLPASLTQGKSTVKVRIQAKDGHSGPSVTSIRVASQK